MIRLDLHVQTGHPKNKERGMMRKMVFVINVANAVFAAIKILLYFFGS